jgi:catechol 2,3-dioxygenase-like lactoylglutathione lyase family enzyme
MARTLPTAPVSPYKLSHAVLRTAHLDETIRHYELLLNTRVVFDDRPRGAALTYDEEHHRLALVAVPAPADNGAGDAIRLTDATGAVGLNLSATPGLEHLAFTFESLGALLGTYRRAKAAGITPEYCLNHGATISFYYADPDGHKNELLIDTMPMEMAEELIHTPEFAANSIGLPFDPDELLADYEAGAPLAELMKIGLGHTRELDGSGWTLRWAVSCKFSRGKSPLMSENADVRPAPGRRDRKRFETRKDLAAVALERPTRRAVPARDSARGRQGSRRDAAGRHQRGG